MKDSPKSIPTAHIDAKATSSKTMTKKHADPSDTPMAKVDQTLFASLMGDSLEGHILHFPNTSKKRHLLQINQYLNRALASSQRYRQYHKDHQTLILSSPSPQSTTQYLPIQTATHIFELTGIIASSSVKIYHPELPKALAHVQHVLHRASDLLKRDHPEMKAQTHALEFGLSQAVVTLTGLQAGIPLSDIGERLYRISQTHHLNLEKEDTLIYTLIGASAIISLDAQEIEELNHTLRQFDDHHRQYLDTYIKKLTHMSKQIEKTTTPLKQQSKEIKELGKKLTAHLAVTRQSTSSESTRKTVANAINDYGRKLIQHTLTSDYGASVYDPDTHGSPSPPSLPAWDHPSTSMFPNTPAITTIKDSDPLLEKHIALSGILPKLSLPDIDMDEWKVSIERNKRWIPGNSISFSGDADYPKRISKQNLQTWKRLQRWLDEQKKIDHDKNTYDTPIEVRNKARVNYNFASTSPELTLILSGIETLLDPYIHPIFLERESSEPVDPISAMHKHCAHMLKTLFTITANMYTIISSLQELINNCNLVINDFKFPELPHDTNPKQRLRTIHAHLIKQNANLHQLSTFSQDPTLFIALIKANVKPDLSIHEFSLKRHISAVEKAVLSHQTNTNKLRAYLKNIQETMLLEKFRDIYTHAPEDIDLIDTVVSFIAVKEIDLEAQLIPIYKYFNTTYPECRNALSDYLADLLTPHTDAHLNQLKQRIL